MLETLHLTVSLAKKLHIATVFSADFVQRLGDLAQTAATHGLHESFEGVVGIESSMLQPAQCPGCLFSVALLKCPQPLELGAFLFRG